MFKLFCLGLHKTCGQCCCERGSMVLRSKMLDTFRHRMICTDQICATFGCIMLCSDYSNYPMHGHGHGKLHERHDVAEFYQPEIQPSITYLSNQQTTGPTKAAPPRRWPHTLAGSQSAAVATSPSTAAMKGQERGVRPAQKIQVGPRTPVGKQLQTCKRLKLAQLLGQLG
jgi:hypothetical protein